MINFLIERFRRTVDTENTVGSWKCPHCFSILIKDEPKNYETLLEHVCDPNGDRDTLRDTFICPNDKCELNILIKGSYYWGIDGDRYTRAHSKLPSLPAIYSSAWSIDNELRIRNFFNLFTFSVYKYELGKRKDKHFVKIGKWMIDLPW